MNTKECRKCEQVKSVDDFGKQAKAKDGLKNYCKECIAEMNKVRYSQNKEKHLSQVKAWQSENKEKVTEYKRRYQKKKRDEARDQV